MEKRESYIKNEMLEFLDDLRESGVTNMWGASAYMESEFPELSDAEAKCVAIYWMKTFGKENR